MSAVRHLGRAASGLEPTGSPTNSPCDRGRPSLASPRPGASGLSGDRRPEAADGADEASDGLDDTEDGDRPEGRGGGWASSHGALRRGASIRSPAHSCCMKPRFATRKRILEHALRRSVRGESSRLGFRPAPPTDTTTPPASATGPVHDRHRAARSGVFGPESVIVRSAAAMSLSAPWSPAAAREPRVRIAKCRPSARYAPRRRRLPPCRQAPNFKGRAVGGS